VSDVAPTVLPSSDLNGVAIRNALALAGVGHVLAVPDLFTAKGLLGPISQDERFTLVRTCKEDETIGIAAGLGYGGLRAVVLIQYTGFLYALNAIRSVACEQGRPICMMVGLLGREPGVALGDSKRLGLRAIVPILEAMGIVHHVIESACDVSLIEPAIETAYATSRPVALLIGARPQ
jgi:sulfopyruvate decarboxylase TPP-binding subunit